MKSAVCALLVAAAIASGCASSRRAEPPPPAAPTDPAVASLVDWLKLDDAQRKRTEALVRELSDRNAAIYKSWENGQKVRPQTLLESRSIFERDFLAILTPAQREQVSKSNVLFATRGRGVR